MQCSKGAVLIPVPLKFQSDSGVPENFSVNLSVMQRYMVAGAR